MDLEPKKPSHISRFVALVKRHPRWTLIIAGAVLIAITGSVTAYLLTRPLPKTEPVVSVVPKPAIKYYSPLSGVEVKDEAVTKEAVTAVMIENSPEARPQSGLKEAGVVFEANAEGGITRFMALYQEAKPTHIGPVRSLRPYYLDWATAFDASIAHVGGSAEALNRVRDGKHRDIDQFFNAGSYWRSTDRYAPHNVYTNFKRLDALNKSKGYTTSDFTGFERQEGKAASEPDATKLTLNLSSALFNTSYTYNAKTNTYKRSMAGEPHNDREKGQLSPDVVIALRVKQTGSYYQNITTSSSGEVVIFQNGTATKATWKKSNPATQLHFVDDDGKEIALNRGQTWITAVPTSGAGSVSWQ